MKIKIKILTILLSVILGFGFIVPNYSAANPVSNHLAAVHKLLPQKAETRIVLKKFLKSMLLVAGSCAGIFLILLIYKRARTPRAIKSTQADISKNLNSPESVDEAVKFFIEKF